MMQDLAARTVEPALGKIDAALMKITEFFQVLPALLFAMVVVTLFSPTLVTVTLAVRPRPPQAPAPPGVEGARS